MIKDELQQEKQNHQSKSYVSLHESIFWVEGTAMMQSVSSDLTETPIVLDFIF